MSKNEPVLSYRAARSILEQSGAFNRDEESGDDYVTESDIRQDTRRSRMSKSQQRRAEQQR